MQKEETEEEWEWPVVKEGVTQKKWALRAERRLVPLPRATTQQRAEQQPGARARCLEEGEPEVVITNVTLPVPREKKCNKCPKRSLQSYLFKVIVGAPGWLSL